MTDRHQPLEAERPEDMVALTRLLVSDPGYARQVGARARAFAESRSWEANLDGLLQEYARLAGRRRRRSLQPQVAVGGALRSDYPHFPLGHV